MKGFLKNVVDKIIEVGSQVEAVPFSAVFQAILFNLPAIIEDVRRLPDKENRKDKIDQALKEFDRILGAECPTNFIDTMPSNYQEICTDHFIEFVRLLLYNAAKLEDYYYLPAGKSEKDLDRSAVGLANTVLKKIVADEIDQDPERRAGAVAHIFKEFVPRLQLKNEGMNTADAILLDLDLQAQAPKRYTTDKQIAAVRRASIYLLKLTGAVDE